VCTGRGSRVTRAIENFVLDGRQADARTVGARRFAGGVMLEIVADDIASDASAATAGCVGGGAGC
jgi:hypothetical protein